MCHRHTLRSTVPRSKFSMSSSRASPSSRKSDQTVVVYTDGACSGNPGPGGWGVYCEELGIRASGESKETTNNKMELQAVIMALKIIDPCNIVIVSDSKYVVQGATVWMASWIKKDFKGVANPEQWKELLSLTKKLSPEFRWVQGHSGDPGNEMADKLANRFRTIRRR